MDRRPRLPSVGDRTVAVFNVDGTLHALDGRCLHRGGPLAEGLVRDAVVTCPWHWWRYDLRTGERLGAPWLRLRRHPVRVEDGQILVEVPPPEPPVSVRELLLRHAASWRAGPRGPEDPGPATGPGGSGRPQDPRPEGL
ncbi:MAG TPA: Rieske (2Fe-2S) protein [Actinomycetota bacterium]|nr:Rieske (2Fe-2S) protein [Actinomycetota bacterium]